MVAEERRGSSREAWPRGCAGLMLDENAPRDLFAAMMQDASPDSKELSFATSVTDIVSDMFFFSRNKLKFDPQVSLFLSCVILELYFEVCIYRVVF